MNSSNLSNLEGTLSRDEMRLVYGGAPGVTTGTCGYDLGNGQIDCGVSKGEALTMFNIAKAAGVEAPHWCCDSCATSTYCGDHQ